MYGVTDIAKIENLEKAPPENKSINPAIPLDCSLSLRASKSTPGTGIKHPILNITINNSKYKSLFLTSGVFTAFFIV